MCRLLLVCSEQEFDIGEVLPRFADIAKNSKEYQGHGWGCAYQQRGEWQLYKTVTPIWEDDLTRFGRTRLLLAHARSAFQNRGIVVDNNMPFSDGGWMFAFNGELRGVRLRETGRTGAEKIFRLIRRLDRGDARAALQQAASILERRSRYIRAMNLIMTDGRQAIAMCYFNEDPDYFTMHYRQRDGRLIVCSEPLSDEPDWLPMHSKQLEVFLC